MDSASPESSSPATKINLAEELETLHSAPHKDLGARVKKLEFAWENASIDVQGNFYYLAFRDGKPTVEEFVKTIYDHIPNFCLPRKEWEECCKEIAKNPMRVHVYQDAIDKAKKLLIRAKNQQKTLGEPGEIILYMLLEVMLNAPQMCCKMALKTSEEMPVHGSDAIHMSFDDASDTLTLYWGESKLYKQLSDALNEVCTSIASFLNTLDGKTPRERDINILRDYMEFDDPATKKAILDYFDPYCEVSNNRREVFACFVGFDFSFFNKLGGLEKAEVEEEFRTQFLKRIASACDLFEKNIVATKLHEFNFHFFLIPFPRVEDIRERFLKLLDYKE